MKKFIYTLAAGSLMLLAASCDNSDSPADWKPAEKNDTAGLYFTTEESVLSITAGEDTHVVVPVKRLKTEEALTVPLVVTTENDKVKFPENVSFEAGQEEAAIVIDLADIPTKELIPITITFPDEYLNPYAAGSLKFEGGVIVSDWERITDSKLTFTWYDFSFQPTNIFDPIEMEMQNLPGTNRYRILNFLNTGYDFTFEVVPSEYELWTGYYRIVPLGNQVMFSEYGYTDYYNSWWLTDATHQEWPTPELMSNGDPITIYGISFLWYDDEYQNEYCYFRPAGTTDTYGNLAEKNSGCFSMFAYYDEDWINFISYFRLCFEFPAE